MDKQLNIEKYLKSLFTNFESYSLTDEEKKLFERDIQAFITKKLFRKKFRKQKLFPNAIADIAKKVALSIKENRPIYFAIPFGGYKHFWNSSHPEPDWAEFFTLKFLTEYVSPILVTYKPGVIIEFISEDLILPRMNNYPDESLEKYAKAFRLLIETYKKYLPENLEFRFFRVSEKFDREQIIQEVEKLLPERWIQWDAYTPEQKEIELKRSKRSVFWNGKLELSHLTNEEKQKKMIESRLIELAYYDVEAKPEFLGNYFMEDNHIGVCFSFGLSPDNFDHWLTLGSTYASTVDYWIGRGILEEKGNSFVNRIISKEQYNKIKNDIQTIATNFDIMPLKNYQTIEVINENTWNTILA